MTFYVYELYDPRDGTAFYVGKGKGNRLSAHEAEASRGRRGRKCDKIRALWASDVQVGKRVVQRFESEDAAFEFEIERIAHYGLAQLTNVLPGGQGRTPPNAMTADQIKARFKERKLAPELAALADRFTASAVFPHEPKGRELGSVFMGALESLVTGSEPQGWRAERGGTFTVLGVPLPGPDALQMLLEFASTATFERGYRMDALVTASGYCSPCEA